MRADIGAGINLLRNLEYFVAVAENEGFGRGAESLGMSQPPVSQGIRRLEAELDVQLFMRGASGAALTDVGRELLPRARLLLTEAARFRSVARSSVIETPEARIGFSKSLALNSIGAILADLAASGAQVAAPPRILSTRRLLADVRDGALDYAVIDAPAVLGSLSASPAIRFPRQVVIRAGSSGASRSGADLLGLPLAAPPRHDNPPSFDALLDGLHSGGVEADLLPTSSIAESLAAVVGGNAFAVVDVNESLPVGTIALELHRATIERSYRVVWAEGVDRDNAQRIDTALRRVSRLAGA